MIRRMLKEEWRMHSELFGSKYFGAFPFVLAMLSALVTVLSLRSPSITVETISRAVPAVAGFLGISVGLTGFSDRDAFKNVLGKTNYLVYSSRTLPISSKRLLTEFVIKDFVYYLGIFIAPSYVGASIGAGTLSLAVLGSSLGVFAAGVIASLTVTRASMKIPKHRLVSYKDSGRLGSLTAKTLIDTLRSSGGIAKVILSAGILSGFYWYAVTFFPTARNFLANPLLSFSIMIGTLNIAVYNWINRFDSAEDYSHLPITEADVKSAKTKSFAIIAVPLTAIMIGVSYSFYPSNLFVSVVSAAATNYFSLNAVKSLAGLEPNRRLLNPATFGKFLGLNLLFIAPLLVFSVFYTEQQALYYLAACFITACGGYVISRMN